MIDLQNQAHPLPLVCLREMINQLGEELNDRLAKPSICRALLYLTGFVKDRWGKLKTKGIRSIRSRNIFSW